MSVSSLYCGVVLDAEAIQAQRLALLAELTAERFASAHLGARGDAHAPEAWAVFHLELAAYLARQVAERERARCAELNRGSELTRGAETRGAESVS
jgi:hypothetical protein